MVDFPLNRRLFLSIRQRFEWDNRAALVYTTAQWVKYQGIARSHLGKRLYARYRLVCEAYYYVRISLIYSMEMNNEEKSLQQVR